MTRTRLSHLRIRGFRNIEHADLDLSAGVNILWGDNAQGKSNALEAVHFLATATSPRTYRVSELIPRGGETAFVEGRIERLDGPETLSIGLDAQKKLIRSNETRVERVHELYGRLPVVSFVPEDMNFVNGSPLDRRRLLDVALAQMEPAHVVRLQRYNKTLRHRNALLRQERGTKLEMESWEEQLARLGAEVMRARGQGCSRWAERLRTLSEELLEGREALALRYQPTVPVVDGEALVDALREKLSRQRDTDRERGATQTGPHRDNIDLRVEGRELRLYGSQGQRRTAVLALRLTEAEEMTERHGTPPLLLADDVIYEMDANRRRAFLARLARSGQCLLTATDPVHLGELAESARRFRVEGGAIAHEQG